MLEIIYLILLISELLFQLFILIFLREHYILIVLLQFLHFEDILSLQRLEL